MLDEHYLMKQVKSVRNACAHNSCIINCFRSGLRSQISTSHSVTTALSKGGVRNSKTRRAKLDNPIMQQIVTTLYAYKTIVNSEASLDRTINALQALKVRIAKNRRYYTKVNALMSFLHFTESVIDIWFPLTQDTCIQKKP